jgi:protein-S-isoprenylcysteine O-methyltransferase Ste14
MDIFTAIYFVGIAVEIAIRAPYSNKRQTEKMSERRITTREKTLLGLLLVGMFILPVVYATASWLDFANYTLPSWAGWAGVAFLAGALFVFWRAHSDLGLNWSPSLEIREKHELITRGIYGIIRHPMYASQWLWVIAQVLLLQNGLSEDVNDRFDSLQEPPGCAMGRRAQRSRSSSTSARRVAFRAREGADSASGGRPRPDRPRPGPGADPRPRGPRCQTAPISALRAPK